MSAQLILARPLLVEGTEQAVFGNAEWTCVQIAGQNGGVGKRVFSRRAHTQRQVTGVDGYIFVTDDTLHLGFTGGHSEIQIGSPGYENLDLEIVVRAAVNPQVSGIAQGLQADSDISCLGGVLSPKTNLDSVFIAADDSEIARPDVQPQLAAGGEIGVKIVQTDFGRIDSILSQGETSQQKQQGEGKGETFHRHLTQNADTHTIVRTGVIGRREVMILEFAVLSGENAATPPF